MKVKKHHILMLVFVAQIACGLLPAGVAPRTPSAPAAPAQGVSPTAPSFAPVPAAGGFASLSELQGGVEAKQPADADFLKAAVGMVLRDLSQVRTRQDGRARLDLSTGTIVRVTPNSLFTLTVKDPEPQNLWVRFQLTLGQLFIVLRGGSVEVETPSGVATVRGSFMSVFIDPKTGDALVQCLEGACQLVTRAGTFSLSTGRQARLRFSAQGVAPLPPLFDTLTENDLQAWLRINPEASEVRDQVRQVIQSLRPGERQPATSAPAPAQIAPAISSTKQP